MSLEELEEAGTDEVVAMISPYYKAKAFEYHTTGFYRIPGDIVQVAAITAATVSNIAKWVKNDARAQMRSKRLNVDAPRVKFNPRTKRSCPMPERRAKNLYVVRLDDAVLQERKFLAMNPDYRLRPIAFFRKPCVYVGVTSHEPVGAVRAAQDRLQGLADCQEVRQEAHETGSMST